MGATSGRGAGARGFPTGTVTFLFTDLEGSAAAQQAHPDVYRGAVRRHQDLLQGAVEGHGGAVFEAVGDAVYAAFARSSRSPPPPDVAFRGPRAPSPVRVGRTAGC